LDLLGTIFKEALLIFLFFYFFAGYETFDKFLLKTGKSQLAKMRLTDTLTKTFFAAAKI
jgi:hypothetical protein